MNISLNGSLWSPQLTFLLMQINICHKENVTHSKFYEPFDESTNSSLAELWCPKIFDGLLCWDATPAGTTAYQNCPKNVDGWKPDRIAFKKCNVHGKWFQHPESNKTWTNFTTCIDVEDLKFREAILVLDICYYTGSFSSLTVSIFIFFRYKLLNSLRTIVHSHLFAAHQLSSLCWIVWNFIMLTQPTFVTDFPIICLCLSFVRMYSTGCCYAWMFDESVIIYRYLVSIDNDDYKYYTTYKIIGWGIPLFLTINYYVARWLMGEMGRCTIDSSYAIYIFAIPILIGMVISAWIFYKVCVVIFNKARSLPGAEGMVATPGTLNNRDNARTARAAAILFFLFGLHLLIMPTNPPLGTLAEKAYALFSGFIIGNQGTIFSCLFCFFNEEVKTRIRNVHERTKRLKEDLNQISGVTTGETINVAEDAV